MFPWGPAACVACPPLSVMDAPCAAGEGAYRCLRRVRKPCALLLLYPPQRPMVLCINSAEAPPGLTHMELLHLRFQRPSAAQLLRTACLVATAEGVGQGVDLAQVWKLVQASGGDVRRCLMGLQFWLAAGGGSSGSEVQQQEGQGGGAGAAAAAHACQAPGPDAGADDDSWGPAALSSLLQEAEAIVCATEAAAEGLWLASQSAGPLAEGFGKLLGPRTLQASLPPFFLDAQQVPAQAQAQAGQPAADALPQAQPQQAEGSAVQPALPPAVAQQQEVLEAHVRACEAAEREHLVALWHAAAQQKLMSFFRPRGGGRRGAKGAQGGAGAEAPGSAAGALLGGQDLSGWEGTTMDGDPGPAGTTGVMQEEDGEGEGDVTGLEAPASELPSVAPSPGPWHPSMTPAVQSAAALAGAGTGEGQAGVATQGGGSSMQAGGGQEPMTQGFEGPLSLPVAWSLAGPWGSSQPMQLHPMASGALGEPLPQGQGAAGGAPGPAGTPVQAAGVQAAVTTLTTAGTPLGTPGMQATQAASGLALAAAGGATQHQGALTPGGPSTAAASVAMQQYAALAAAAAAVPELTLPLPPAPLPLKQPCTQEALLQACQEDACARALASISALHEQASLADLLCAPRDLAPPASGPCPPAHQSLFNLRRELLPGQNLLLACSAPPRAFPRQQAVGVSLGASASGQQPWLGYPTMGAAVEAGDGSSAEAAVTDLLAYETEGLGTGPSRQSPTAAASIAQRAGALMARAMVHAGHAQVAAATREGCAAGVHGALAQAAHAAESMQSRRRTALMTANDALYFCRDMACVQVCMHLVAPGCLVFCLGALCTVQWPMLRNKATLHYATLPMQAHATSGMERIAAMARICRLEAVRALETQQGLVGRARRSSRFVHALTLSCPDMPEWILPGVQELGMFGGH